MRNHHSATLLLALPFVVAIAPAFASPVRTIEITLSRSLIAPVNIEVQAGERARLNVTSADGAQACQVKGLGLDGRIPAGGTMTFELLPAGPGEFELECVDAGSRRDSSRVRLVVKGDR